MNNTENKNIIDKNRLSLGGLCIYRNLLSDPIIAAFRALCDAAVNRPHITVEVFIERYSDFFNKLSQADRSLDFPHYVFYRILQDENAFTMSSAAPRENTVEIIKSAAYSDIRALKTSVSITSSNIIECFLDENRNRNNAASQAVIDELPGWVVLQNKTDVLISPDGQILKGDQTVNPAQAGAGSGKCFTADELWQLWVTDGTCKNFINGLMIYHATNGSGVFTINYAFTWHRKAGNADSTQHNGFLVPVKNPDPVRLSDLIAYESEREEVIKNTEQFLEGYQSNNVLLYGDRGTGKSSTVKALLNEYSDRGLRMIEVPKHLLTDFPEIIGLLAERPHKFILFVDDLSFEDSEDSYTALKAVIEGGLEVKPNNVLIYATSNRRHLVRENFSDRAGLQFGSPDDEIRSIDTMQEKLSLSDRFGITVIFTSPDKKRFLEIVDTLAQKKGICMDTETLHKEALKWELWYNGRSPRTAQQFISYISCKKD